jgi:ceramide glucosyltransferase
VRAFWILFAPAAAYQALAIFASGRHLWRRRSKKTCATRGSRADEGVRPTLVRTFQPGVSILKPVRGLDPNTYEAFVSQAVQDYPVFELLFGVRDEDDPAVPEIRRLQSAFPEVAIRLIHTTTDAPNGKVAVLVDLARHARHPIWVVNDSDIKVTPAYLNEIVAPLEDSSVGIVTCLYSARAHSLATIWEAIGIATDFMPSILVAQLLGVRDFGLGSTLAFRASDLRAAGGFEALSKYIADDYRLAKGISALGKRALLSTYTVETSLGEGTWRGVWLHQQRWSRTIKVSKPTGFAGLPIAHAGVWALAAGLCGAHWPLALLVTLRIASALLISGAVLKAPTPLISCWLSPLWDLYAFAVWVSSFAGNRVRWRDRFMTIEPDGRISVPKDGD